MRTTVDLSKPLLQQARKRASQLNTTLSQVVEEALKAFLSIEKTQSSEPPFKLITYGVPGGTTPPSPQEIDRIVLDDELPARRKPSSL